MLARGYPLVKGSNGLCKVVKVRGVCVEGRLENCEINMLRFEDFQSTQQDQSAMISNGLLKLLLPV